jgi:hypothetical protein
MAALPGESVQDISVIKMMSMYFDSFTAGITFP